MNRYLSDYAQYVPVVQVNLDWQSVALWSEALSGLDAQGEIAITMMRSKSKLQAISRLIGMMDGDYLQLGVLKNWLGVRLSLLRST